MSLCCQVIEKGFPNAVIQAGAMELPSIVTNISGCNEIIKDYKNGIIVPKKDKKILEGAMHALIQVPWAEKKPGSRIPDKLYLNILIRI